ncbi:MAG: hypothetical protein ABIE74_11610 [Pseudomonadota bacterium]
MKKSWLVLIILLVAVASSAATIGVTKLLSTMGKGEIIIITDKRCEECNPAQFEPSLKARFPEYIVKVVDYSDSKGKSLYKEEKLKGLPAILISKDIDQKPEFESLKRFAVIGKDYYSLKTPANFDPNAEICNNSEDDNGDNLVDCADPTCKSDMACMEKREKPDVDVFVMSHCPFGTQIEKGLLPVWDLIGDKANINIRFVDYAMHGKKEVDEQLKQYCIQQDDMGKYKKYLKCFLQDGTEGDKCTKAAGVDSAKLSACIKKSDAKFNISKDFENKEKWKGRFPPFGVDAGLAKKYGVQGSPTLVVNDVSVRADRSPQAILETICMGFKDKPAECNKKLDAAAPSPGFGAGKSQKGSKGSCG